MSLKKVLLQKGAALLAPKHFDASELRRQAEQDTGLRDTDEHPIQEPLEILCRAANDPGVSDLGKIFLKNVISKRLQTRLRIENYLRQNPAVLQEQVRRPVIILGMPRTGTTLLHRLLAQDPESRAPVTWEMGHVAPPPTPQDWDSHPARADAERRSKIRSK